MIIVLIFIVAPIIKNLDEDAIVREILDAKPSLSFYLMWDMDYLKKNQSD